MENDDYLPGIVRNYVEFTYVASLPQA